MEGGPASVKCHSKRFVSRGEACRLGSGWVWSSEASRRMRFTVGDLVLKLGGVVILVGRMLAGQLFDHMWVGIDTKLWDG